MHRSLPEIAAVLQGSAAYLLFEVGVNLECTYGQVDLYTDGGVIGNASGKQTFYTCEINPNLLYPVNSFFDWKAAIGIRYVF